MVDSLETDAYLIADYFDWLTTTTRYYREDPPCTCVEAGAAAKRILEATKGRK